MAAARLALVNFGFNPWSPYWKRNQTLVYLLVQRGVFERAVFVNRPIWLGDLPRLLRPPVTGPTRHWLAALLPRRVHPRILAFTPVVRTGGGPLRVFNLVGLRHHLAASGGLAPPAVTVVNHPSRFIDPLLAALPVFPVGRVFDLSDDFRYFSSDPAEQARTAAWCEGEFARADLVLSVNEHVDAWARSVTSASVVVRNATPFFIVGATAGAGPRGRALRRLASLRRPIIGYVGWLNSLRLDLDLLEHVVRHRPDWTFLFVGPSNEAHPLGTRIPACANVRVWPPIPYRDLVHLLSSLDVAIMPHLQNEHTAGNDPLKIYDYLAAGRPVVATPAPGTERFGALLRLAEAPDDFLRQIEGALAETDSSLARQRVAAAREHSWERRIEDVERALRSHLPCLGGR
jgi:glycosyltransferase involved in cell wall biosynthesis